MRRPRIIIFDDDPVILEMLDRYFSLVGYEVQAFGEPVFCRSSRKTCLNPCADIIVTDFRMPGINGSELLDHQIRRGCHIDINNKAVVSGNLPEESMEKIAGSAGIFFRKPFRMREIHEWTRECINRADLSRPLGGYLG